MPTPYLCRVFEHGVDVAVHPATRYIGGHGTSIGGVIVDSGNFDWTAHAERFPGLTKPDHAYHEVVWTEAVGNLAYIIRARTVLLRNTGAAIAPMNSWLPLQGLETLHLRMERHSSNALTVARYLEQHNSGGLGELPGPGIVQWHRRPSESSPGAAGVVSFGLKAGREGGSKLVESLELFSHLANIGDAESLVIHNASTTHSQLTEDELAAAGVAPEMVRLSVGIEHVDNLIADLDQALAQF